MGDGETGASWPRAAARRLRSPDPRTLTWSPCFEERSGQGVAATLVDTGFDWAAPIFRGCAVDYVDLLGGGSRDPSGHGTRVAALLLCPSPDGQPGLAGGLELTVIKAVGGGPRAVASALRVAERRRARIVLLPFGRMLPDAAVTEAVAGLRAAGTEILAAAGNRGPEAMLFPASLRGVAAVSGLDPDGTVLPECPDGPAVTWLAPGLVRCPLDGRAMRGSSAAVAMAAGLRALHAGS